MRIAHSASLILACFLGLGCAGSPPAASPLTQVGAPVASPQSLAPDLSPVSEPQQLMGLVRFRNPKNSLTAVERVAGLPSLLAALARNRMKVKDLEVVRLDASYDCASVLSPESTDDEPKVHGACSIPLVGFEQARPVFEKHVSDVRTLEPGVLRGRVRPGRSSLWEKEVAPETVPEDLDDEDEYNEDDEPDEPAICDLTFALGKAPARLVCGETAKDLDAVRPWLCRGMPTQTYGSKDFYAEIRFAPLQARYGSVLEQRTAALSREGSDWLRDELKISDPELLAAPGDVLIEGVRLVRDLDKLVVSGHIDEAGRAIQLAGTIQFNGSTSWFTRLLTHRNGNAGPPPDIFWRAPRDAHSVSYGKGADRALTERPWRLARRAVTVLLAQSPLSSPTRTAINELLATVPIDGATAVSAQGSIAPKYRKRKNTKRRPADAIVQSKDLINSYFGWTLVGIEAPSAGYVAALRKTQDAFVKLKADAFQQFPDLKTTRSIPKTRIVNRPAGYPRGTVALDIRVDFDSELVWEMTAPTESLLGDPEPHPPGARAKGSITLRVAVTPDGKGRTWVGFSADHKVLRARLRGALASGPKSGTIASLSGLEALKTQPTVSGGFFVWGDTLKRTWGGYKGALSKEEQTGLEEAFKHMPNGLNTPILMLGKGDAGSRPAHGMEVRIQHGTIQDMVGLIQFLASDEGKKVIETFDKKMAEEGMDDAPAP